MLNTHPRWNVGFLRKESRQPAVGGNWARPSSFSEAVPMSADPPRRRSRGPVRDVVQKPRGTFPPRVLQVGPEHLGIVAVGCAKACSRGMPADAFGPILVQLRQAVARHDFRSDLALFSTPPPPLGPTLTNLQGPIPPSTARQARRAGRVAAPSPARAVPIPRASAAGPTGRRSRPRQRPAYWRQD